MCTKLCLNAYTKHIHNFTQLYITHIQRFTQFAKSINTCTHIYTTLEHFTKTALQHFTKKTRTNIHDFTNICINFETFANICKTLQHFTSIEQRSTHIYTHTQLSSKVYINSSTLDTPLSATLKYMQQYLVQH